MNKIKEYIISELNATENRIKRNEDKASDISLKNELLDMVYLIDLYEKYKLSRKNIERIIILPDIYTSAAEYRVVDDCESENRQHWQEIEINGTPIRLHSNDLIFKMK
jgi:hypothetical protein